VDVRNQGLTSEKKDGVLELHLFPVKDRAGVLQLASELRGLCGDILLDPGIRVIVVAGAEETSFSIEPETVLPGSDEVDGLEESAEGLAEPLAQMDVPVLAAIEGDAIGPGLELALACDVRIGSEGSRYGLPHIPTGLVPWDGGTQRLSRLVGRAKAMELILTGASVDAGEAFRIGLISKVVPRGEVKPLVMAAAREMAARAPVAVRYAKEAISKGMDMTLAQGLRLEADLYFLLHTTRDRTEGIQAFRDKKKPTFRGD
jgi:enoyl-CoA hydratase/carnithine racemase